MRELVGLMFFSATPSTIRAWVAVTRPCHATVAAWGVRGQIFRVRSQAFPQDECPGLQRFRIRLPVAEPIPERALGFSPGRAGFRIYLHTVLQGRIRRRRSEAYRIR
jgi:hypothetical protein